MKTQRASFALATSISAFLVSFIPAKAVDYTWSNTGTGDWALAGNWNNGTPGGGGGNFVYINNGGTANITSTTNSIQDPFVGNGAGAVGHVNQTAGDHSNTGWTFIGRAGGVGTWDMSGSTSMTTGRIYLGGVRDTAGGGTGTLTVGTTGTVTANSDFSIGTNGGSGTLNVSNGTVRATGWMIIGETQAGRGGSTGVVNQTGGVVSNGTGDANGRFWLGSNENNSAGAASSGTYNLINGTLNIRNVFIGKNYTGTFNQSGGIANITAGADDTRIGAVAGSNGSYTLSGGVLNKVGAFQVGASGTGTMSISGGTMNSTGWLTVGRFVGGTGTMTVSSGSLIHNDNATSMIIGEEGTGTVTISGTGTVNIASTQGLRIGHTATGNGTINLNGGTLAANFIQKTNAGSIAKINFDGGTLKANANSGDFFVGMTNTNLEVKAGGLKFDSNTFSATVNQGLDGVGGVTKVGNGTLVLASGGSTYGGATTLSAGALSVAGLSDGGAPSTLGGSSSAASNLVFDGGALRFTGLGTSTNRNFTINTGKTAIIDVSTAGGILTLSGGSALTNGGLTKIGDGTLSLTGANAHTGTTNVNAGVLAASGSFSSPFVVNTGGHLTAVSLAEGNVTVPSLTLNTGSSLDYEFGGTASLNAGHDLITIGNPGGLTLGSTGLYLYQTGGTSPFTTNGTYTILDYAGSFTGTLNTSFSIANSQVGKVYGLLNNTTATTIELTIADAVAAAWNVAGGGSWNTGANWNPIGVPNSIGAIATFGSIITAPSTITVDGAKTVGTIVFNNTNSYTLTGSASDVITLNNGFGTPIISQVNGSHTIAAPLALSASTNLDVIGGTTLTLAGDISGPGNLTLINGGAVVLTGTNSYAATVVNNGSLNVGNGGATGTLGSGPVSLAAGTSLAFNRTADLTVANNISGAGTVTYAASGAITYTGADTHTGATVLSNGPFTSTGTINGTSNLVVDNTTTLQGASVTNVAGPVTVGGGAPASLSVTGTASLSSTGNAVIGNGFTGSASVSGGTWTAASFFVGNTTSGTLNITSGSVASADFYVGAGASAVGTVNLFGGTLTTNHWTVIGDQIGSSGTVNQTGGTWNQNHTDVLSIGQFGDGKYFMSGNSVLNNQAVVDTSNRGTNKGNVAVGRFQNGGIGGVGLWDLSGNATARVRALVVGDQANTNGTVNVADAASIVSPDFDLFLGVTGTGRVNVNGGSMSFNQGWAFIGRNAGGNGTLTVNAGTFSSNRFYVGESGVGAISVTGGTFTANDFVHLGEAAAGSGSFSVSGSGTANLANGFVAGQAGTGNLNVSGGTLNITNGATIGGVGAGTATISGGALNTNGTFIVGNGGTNTGMVTQTGGAVSVNGELWVGQNVGNGTYNLQAGSVTVNNWVAVGRQSGTGTFNMSGGTFSKTGGNGTHITLGSNPGTGYWNQSGGILNTADSDVFVGENGTGTFTTSGTAVANVQAFVVGVNAGSSGTVQLNGGVVNTNYITAGAGTAQLNYNGGTLRAVADQADFIRGFTAANSNIQAGGAIFDTNGFAVALNHPLAGTGSLTKIGNGSLTLNASQNYSALNASVGTTNLNAALGTGGSTATANGTLNFAVAQKLAALNVGAAGVAKMTAHVGGPANIAPMDTSALTITAGGKFDLTNNVLVVRGGTFATIRNQVASGFNGGSWNGAGINSSTATNDPLGLTALAVASNVDLGYSAFGNVTGLTGNEILVKTTYYGDNDLSGTVTTDDFSLFLDGFTGAAPASWLNGDYDYDGVVTTDDFSLFLASLTSGAPALSASGPAAGGPSAGAPAAVPEPGSIGLLFAGALGLLSRRRRKA